MKYSILIPAYKSKFFRECLESVFAQSFDDYEIVILNDCSPEGLDTIVADFKDKRLRYYKNKENVGAERVVDNWNKLLSLSKGEYVVCMGDDDKLTPNFLEAYNTLMLKYPGLDLYHARTEIIDEKSQFKDIQEDRPDKESAYAMMWNCIFGSRIQFIGDFLFKASKLKANGGFFYSPLAWGADCVSTYIAAKDTGCANLHEPTFLYRSNSYSITSSENARLKVEATRQIMLWTKQFIENTPADGIDAMYRELLRNGLDQQFLRDMRYSLADDMRHHIFHLFYWMKHRGEYGLPVTTIAMSLSMAIGLKLLYRRK